MASASLVEALRAGLGALVGLCLTGIFVLSPVADLELGLYLIAPFGASSVLLFAVPNSPLAQPWSAIVGNTVAALVGVAVCLWIAEPSLRIGLAVGLAITATILCRAVHPPAGAVAMTAAMSPEAIEHLGFWFALAPVALGTICLVLVAAAYARLTGRRYPFRQFDDPNRHQTGDKAPAERLGLSEQELSAILERYSQSFNIGVEDLARLIGAAELEAASHAAGPSVAADVMSRDLVTVAPGAPLRDIATLFRHHGFTSLPVVDEAGTYLGVIFQMQLIQQLAEAPASRDGSYLQKVRARWAGPAAGRRRARDIMVTETPRAAMETSVAALFHMMAQGETDAVPVLVGRRIAGIVTRTDLIAALAREIVRRG